MARLIMYLAASAALAGLAAPAIAQTAYPYAQQHPQPAYGYPSQPGHGANPLEQTINQLLGNRYNAAERSAIERCVSAAMVEASHQYGGSTDNERGQPYSEQYGYNGHIRLTAITNVQRFNHGLRVSGLLASGYGVHGNRGYGDPRYSARGDLSFRCNVDYHGAVTRLRVRRD